MATRTIGDSATTTVVRRRTLGETYVGQWLTTTDHKMIGMMYIITGFLFFMVGGLEAMLIRAELAGLSDLAGFRVAWEWLPPWRPADMTDAGRDQLRAIGFSF